MDYRVLRQICAGGFSVVFEVEDPASALPERLVLKRLTPEMSARADVRAAFAAEAEILRELRHPNIVMFRRCYFDEKQRVCLLMEKVRGEPLDVWASHDSRRSGEVLDALEKIFQAVADLHRRPVPYLHLDLKPDNILVSTVNGEPRPVLIDFGIARRSGARGLKAYTPPYGAPEQEKGGTLRCATDVYALGQIMSEILAVSPLEDGPVLQALRGVAAKAKQPSPNYRFTDAGEMGLALRRARRATPPPADSVFSGLRLPRAVKPPSSKHLVVGLGAAAIITVMAIGLRAPQPAPEAESDLFSVWEGSLENTDARRRFGDLLSEARDAAQRTDFEDADAYYLQASALVAEIPDSSAAREMKKDLDRLRDDISRARLGHFHVN